MFIHKKVLPLILTMTALNSANNVSSAADWNVTQTSNVVVSSSSLNQGGAGSSQQALNGVVVDTANDDVSSVSQTSNIAGGDLSLTQTGANTNGSVQALNLVSARSIDGLTQTVTGVGTANMVQDANLGGGNVQALNYALSATNTADLTQTVDGNQVTAVNSSSGNVQAINYAESATYTGELVQDTTLLTLDATNLGGTDVRVNSIKGDVSGVSSPVSQSATIGTLTVSGATTVILNHIEP